jgi:hypothetical protein
MLPLSEMAYREMISVDDFDKFLLSRVDGGK